MISHHLFQRRWSFSVKRDHDMSVSGILYNVWWPDLLKLHEKYGIVHTGVVIENYEAQTDGKICSTKRFRSFRILEIHFWLMAVNLVIMVIITNL